VATTTAAAAIAVLVARIDHDVGFAEGDWPGAREIYDYETVRSEPVARAAKQINGYLVDFRPIYVTSRDDPLKPVPRASFGSMPNDDGFLILADEQAERLRDRDPGAARFLREMVSAREWLHGERRWCLWLMNASGEDIRGSNALRRRVERVRQHRTASNRAATRRLAQTTHLFGEIRQPRTRYLCVPRHAGEARRIFPMGFFEPGVIASDSTITIEHADLYLFGILQSAMFTTWLRTVGGRIKNDPRFSVEAVYNTFPFPDPSAEQRAAIETAAALVLDVREQFPERSLADLYDPLALPPELARAHDTLDHRVDTCFAPRRRFSLEVERASVLFESYASLVADQRLAMA